MLTPEPSSSALSRTTSYLVVSYERPPSNGSCSSVSTAIGSQDSHEEVLVQDGEVNGEKKSYSASPRMVLPLRLLQERDGHAESSRPSA